MAAARSYVPAESAGADLDRTIAHLLKTAQVNTGHLDVHAAAARDGGDPALVTHHLRHALNHARRVSSHLVKLHDAVSRRVPGVAAQLEDLAAVIPGARAAAGLPPQLPAGALDMSIAHDLANGQAAAAHVDRHLSEALLAQSAGNAASVKFNGERAADRIADRPLPGGAGHGPARRLPEVGREAAALKEAGNLQPSELRPPVEAAQVGAWRLRCHAAERRA